MTSLTHPNLIERLTKLYAELALQTKSYDADAIVEARISTLTAEVEELRALLGDVHRCRMEAGEGRFVNLAKLRKVMGRIDATLKGEGTER